MALRLVIQTEKNGFRRVVEAQTYPGPSRMVAITDGTSSIVGGVQSKATH